MSQIKAGAGNQCPTCGMMTVMASCPYCGHPVPGNTRDH